MEKKARTKRARGRTHQSEYRLSILEALSEMGGKGFTQDILDKVGEKMKLVLKPIDYEKISAGMIRWRNAAMWERNKMVLEGLLRSDSPRGIWEISERGKQVLSRRETFRSKV